MLRKLLDRILRARRAANPSGRQFALVQLHSTIGRQREVFREVVDVVSAGLEALGHTTLKLQNEFRTGGQHIVFCPHLLRAEDVDSFPASTVLYNFEQLDPPALADVASYVTHYAPRFHLWEYSPANVRYLAARGCDVRHVPLGYAPVLTRIVAAPDQDIDVFFSGVVNPRRSNILEDLRACGLRVVTVTDVYGDERDALIARAKVVLDVYSQDDVQAFLTPRIFYLLANRKAVVSEVGPNVTIDPDLKAAMACAPYDGLVDACVKLVRDAGYRAALESAGLACMRNRDEAAILRTVLTESRPA